MTDAMVTILVVDDEENITEAIRSRLEEPRWRVDVFQDVVSGVSAIKRARDNGWMYDAAILDFCLPASPTSRSPEVDITLCSVALKEGVPVWHITAHQSPEIKIDVNSSHSADELHWCIDKGPGFIGALEQQVKSVVASRRVRYLLNSMAGGVSESGFARRYRPDLGDHSVTALLMRACSEIGFFWSLLHPALQEELKALFDVQLGDDGTSATIAMK